MRSWSFQRPRRCRPSLPASSGSRCERCGKLQHGPNNPIPRTREEYARHGLLWVNEATMVAFEHCKHCGVLFDVREMSDEELESHNDGSCANRRWAGPYVGDTGE